MYKTDDFQQLSVLHKAVLAAKFSGRAINDELSGDPVLAGVANDIYDELGKLGEKKQIGSNDYWQDWRRVKTSQGFRGQWRTAVIAARRDPVMQSASPEERLSLAKCWLSPFTCTDGELRAFLDDVDGKTGEHDLGKLFKEQSFTGASLLECSCELGASAHIVFMLKNMKVCDIFFSGIKRFELVSKGETGDGAIAVVDKASAVSGRTQRLELALSYGRNKKSLTVEADSIDYWI